MTPRDERRYPKLLLRVPQVPDDAWLSQPEAARQLGIVLFRIAYSSPAATWRLRRTRPGGRASRSPAWRQRTPGATAPHATQRLFVS